MKRRTATVIGALALSLVVPTAAAHAGTPPSASTLRGVNDDPGRALSRLTSAAHGRLRVHRLPGGRVNHLSSADGRALLPAPAGSGSPREAAEKQLARYGQAFGIDGTTSKAAVSATIPSSTGGAIVRAQQVVDGVPVFGGQVVTTLDRNGGLVSVDAATTSDQDVTAPRVSRVAAAGVARDLVARDSGVRRTRLHVVDQGRHLYDPALVHEADPLGPRPVWQFEVGDGGQVRELVLVGTQRGEVALHFDEVEGLNRKVCDNADQQGIASDTAVPLCASPARTESGGVSSVTDVNAAFDNLGAVAQAYQDLDGLDLTSIIGQGTGSAQALSAVVRWCYSDVPCPYGNAFWDGRQMVFGDDYAGADDVVGHELTHGYVERTSNLFNLHQSGSINESLADTMGEIVDHRYNPDPSEDNSDWVIGEATGDPSVFRSLKDPTTYSQPDTMTSGLYRSDAVDDDSDNDLGDVHLDDGVGNKTAYLISQGTTDLPGGSFHGHTFTGIDAGDDGLAKTGRLYLETIPALTSGSDYADLGTVLLATCQRLAATHVGGFGTDDCATVSEAVSATELGTVPPGGAPQAAVTCPSDRTTTLLARDDDAVHQFGFTTDAPSLWRVADGNPVPSYATSGSSSLFALDPDPSLGDADHGSLTSKAFTVPLSTGGTYLNFHHAYVFDAADDPTSGTYQYYDGAQVMVQKRLSNGTWSTVSLPGSAWVNGPDRHVEGAGTGFTGFGGDSQGYRGSQLSLTSLAGQTVRFVFRVEGDSVVSLFGWWIDDVRLYSCAMPAPGAPTSVTVKGATGAATVSWKPPTSGTVGGYLVTRSDGTSRTVPASARSLTLTAFTGTTPVTVSVSALAADRTAGPSAGKVVYPTVSSLTSSVARATKRKAFVLTARVVRRGTSSAVAAMPVLLQRRVAGTSRWVDVSASTTGSTGTRAWRLTESKATSYRVLARGTWGWFASTSGSRSVGVR